MREKFLPPSFFFIDSPLQKVLMCYLLLLLLFALLFCCAELKFHNWIWKDQKEKKKERWRRDRHARLVVSLVMPSLTGASASVANGWWLGSLIEWARQRRNTHKWGSIQLNSITHVSLENSKKKLDNPRKEKNKNQLTHSWSVFVWRRRHWLDDRPNSS